MTTKTHVVCMLIYVWKKGMLPLFLCNVLQQEWLEAWLCLATVQERESKRKERRTKEMISNKNNDKTHIRNYVMGWHNEGKKNTWLQFVLSHASHFYHMDSFKDGLLYRSPFRCFPSHHILLFTLFLQSTVKRIIKTPILSPPITMSQVFKS